MEKRAFVCLQRRFTVSTRQKYGDCKMKRVNKLQGSDCLMWYVCIMNGSFKAFVYLKAVHERGNDESLEKKRKLGTSTCT